MVLAVSHQFSLSRLARFGFRLRPGNGRLPVLPIEGEDARMGRRGLQFRYKDNALFCYNKIKTEYFCLFCKILLERACLFKTAVFFCVAREKIRPRHAVIFSMPCAWRGVKENYSWQCVMSVIFCQNSTNLTYTPQILHFDVPSSKCCVARHTPKPA